MNLSGFAGFEPRIMRKLKEVNRQKDANPARGTELAISITGDLET